MNDEQCKCDRVWTGWRYHQCTRKATKDGWCWQHHPDHLKAKQAKQEEKYRRAREQSPWRRIEKLTEEVRRLKLYGEVVAELCPEKLFNQIEGEFHQRERGDG